TPVPLSGGTPPTDWLDASSFKWGNPTNGLARLCAIYAPDVLVYKHFAFSFAVAFSSLPITPIIIFLREF
ncbi:MAG: hypothetical protein V7L25_15710, partial [Nostoc sp.]|uniref:hypothetical protein n=1 Tax=Nostoc sp. TaxID=1180 RepID=UPI002FF3E203